jgi:hypothetical protein
MVTRNLAKIEVVEEEKIYNFDFGRKLRGLGSWRKM